MQQSTQGQPAVFITLSVYRVSTKQRDVARPIAISVAVRILYNVLLTASFGPVTTGFLVSHGTMSEWAQGRHASGFRRG